MKNQDLKFHKPVNTLLKISDQTLELTSLDLEISEKGVRLFAKNIDLFIPIKYVSSTGKNKLSLLLFLRGDEDQQNED
jgi:hypothetical protein